VYGVKQCTCKSRLSLFTY